MNEQVSFMMLDTVDFATRQLKAIDDLLSPMARYLQPILHFINILV